jgi:hypothetical protein
MFTVRSMPTHWLTMSDNAYRPQWQVYPGAKLNLPWTVAQSHTHSPVGGPPVECLGSLRALAAPVRTGQESSHIFDHTRMPAY